MPAPVGSDPNLAQLVVAVQSFDLGVSSWFKVLDPRSFLADLRGEGMGIDPRAWRDVGAFGVVKVQATVSGGQANLQFKLYEVDKGAQPVLERQYTGAVADARKLTHRWCNEVVKYYTDEDGFFGSQITFSTGRKIMVMDFDGNGPYAITQNDSINILPAFSPNGGQIAFTSYMRGNPDIYTVATGGGRPKRIAKYNGMNTGAAWSPDSRKLAVTLSKDGNAEIYLLNPSDGTVEKRLTDNRYIDTSPAWSPDRLGDRVRLEPRGRPADLRDERGWLEPAPGVDGGLVQHHAVVVAEKRDAHARIHGARRFHRQVRHHHPRPRDRQAHAHHAEPGLERGADLVAQRPGSRLLVDALERSGDLPRQRRRHR